MSTPPEVRIRDHLARRGTGTSVELHRLMGTWGLGTEDAGARDVVAAALDDVGITVTPRIADARADQVMTLTLTRPPAPSETPAPSEAPPPAPSAPRQAPQPAGVASPALPRTLLTVGASLLVLSLFLPWFRGETGGIAAPDLSTGWQWLSVLDVYLVLVVVLTVLLLATDLMADLGPRAVAAAAALAFAATALRTASPPEDRIEGFLLEVSVRIGPFAALLALALVLAGAALLVVSPTREGTVLPDGQARGAAPS